MLINLVIGSKRVPLSPQKVNAVHLFLFNKTLTFNKLAFFVLLKQRTVRAF